MRSQIFLTCAFLTVNCAAAAAKSWTGAVSGLWSVGGNWSDGTAPVDGDALVFPAGAAHLDVVNDLPAGLQVQSVSFAGAPCGDYSLTGNLVVLAGGLTISGFGGECFTWSIPITLAASQTFDLSSGFPTLAGTIDLGGHTLTLRPLLTKLSGEIVGVGDLVVPPATGGLDVSGSISILGEVTVSGDSSLNVSGAISATELSMGPRLGDTPSNHALTGDGSLPDTSLDRVTMRLGNGPVGSGDNHDRGTLTTSDFSAMAGVMAFDLVSSAPGAGHDQLVVNGTVVLDDPVLRITFPGILPGPGQSFVLIDNDLVDAVLGTFAGLPEGILFTVGTTELQITYQGGSGNDIVVSTPDELPTPLAIPTASRWALSLLVLLLALAGLRLIHR